VSRFIFLQLCFSDEEKRFWIEDPIAYAQKRTDFMEDYESAATSATYLFVDLATKRRKHTIDGILSFINGVLNEYQTAPPEAQKPEEKEGALRMIAAIADYTLQKKFKVAHLMESFFATHVLPEFYSQHPFLRARVRWSSWSAIVVQVIC
jgi:hypothetical protein